MAFIFKLTPAGRAALISPDNTGTEARTIVSVGITADAIVSGNAISNEIKRIATIAGDLVADDTIHVTIRDDTLDEYDVLSFGFYLDNGVLLGSYGQGTPIISKTSGSVMLLSIDARLLDASVDISTLVFGDTSFVNPQATTERKGVVELATPTEVTTGLDNERAVTSAGLKVELDKKAPTSRAITAGTGLTGGGDLTANRSFALAASGVAAGTYGSSSAIPTFTVDAYGRLTVAGSVALTPAWANVTGKPSVLAGTGLTGGGDLSTNRTLSLANTAVVPGTYGAATKIPRVTVDQQGRITGVSEISVTAGIPVLTTGTALPTSDIGPIWHDDYQSIMTWQAFTANGAAYTGYASLLVGNLLADTQQTPRLGYVASGATNLSRTTYAALRAWGLHVGLFVAPGIWVGGGLLMADNADGTTFRVYDVRGEFPRFFDGGRGVDPDRVWAAWQKGSLLVANENYDAQVHGFQALNDGLPYGRSGLGWETPDMTQYYPRGGFIGNATSSATGYSTEHYGVARSRNAPFAPHIKF